MKHNKIKYFAIVLTATLGVVLLPIKSNANNIENEFKNVLAKYDINEVIVENGISLTTGEVLDLSEYPDWDLSNAKVVSIDENGTLKAMGEGTVFLSQEINGKAHIIEIYVQNDSPKPIMHSVSRGITSVNRDYYKVFIDPGTWWK